MGIYDRDYYRREGPSFLDAFARQGQVCKWLVIANIVAFIIQIVTRQQGTEPFTDFFCLNLDRVWAGEVWRLLTHAFLHSTADPWHILINMLFLWWFGQDLEERMGHGEFLAFYLSAALAGGITFLLGAKLDLMLGGNALGASGAVTAVMVVFAFYHPHHVILLMFVLPVPIWLLVVFQVGKDFLAFLNKNPNGIAVTAHLGGAAFGALYYAFQWRILSLWPNLRARQRQRARPRLRVYHEEEPDTPQPVSVGAAPLADVDEQLEAKLDAVLAKVARTGQASLTDNEKQILMRASEIYKKRRS